MRHLFAALCVALLALATPPATHARDQGAARIVFEEWFRGTTTARGVFEIPITGVRREFTMTARGTWDGRVFTLVEDFVFSDGERDRKTWRLRKLADGRFVGRREDSNGDAELVQDGNDMRMRYELVVTGAGGRPTILGFDDRFFIRPDGVLVTEAVVSYLGIPVGRAVVEFRRPASRQR